MTDPINLTAIRADAEHWNRWHPPEYTADHAAAVLALIDTAEAAHASFWTQPEDIEAATAMHNRLASALARFTWNEP